MDDCWAVGAVMEYDHQVVTRNTHLARVYWATYQFMTDILQSEFWKLL